jgi:hypothetical protein
MFIWVDWFPSQKMVWTVLFLGGLAGWNCYGKNCENPVTISQVKY